MESSIKDRYYMAHDVFQEKSNDSPKSSEILRLHLQPLVRKILQTNRVDQFNILGVGSGDGAVDIAILKIVHEELQRDDKYQDLKIFNRAVEPSARQIKLYKKAIENLPESMKGQISFDLHTKTFDGYTQERSKEEPLKFDIVHFIHSVNFINVEQTLQHDLEKELRKNGRVLIVVGGREDLIEVSSEILRLHLQPLVRKILQTNRVDQFNILGVGSGDGAVDIAILKIVHEELQRDDKYQDLKIFNRAVEPSARQIKLYKKAIENLPESMKGQISFDLHTKTFDGYTQERSKEEPLKFDIVHFIHSVNFINVEQTLQHDLEKELRKNGRVLIVVGGREDLIEVVRAFYSQRCGRSRPEISADEVIKATVKNGWKYEMFAQEFEIDVTEVFDEDSIKGNLLLDFMTGLMNFRDTAEQAHIEQVLSVMRDQTTVRDGKRLGKRVKTLIVLSK
ncbi:hypothetical protein QZH41_006369 [Actinostola sp. cb2023]|nr:hypothetical protein QZH41_006369 [Actinostola sp. cb2023]